MSSWSLQAYIIVALDDSHFLRSCLSGPSHMVTQEERLSPAVEYGTFEFILEPFSDGPCSTVVECSAVSLPTNICQDPLLTFGAWGMEKDAVSPNIRWCLDPQGSALSSKLQGEVESPYSDSPRSSLIGCSALPLGQREPVSYNRL